MAKVIIGGVEREGDLRTFAKLELAWPLIQEAKVLEGQVTEATAISNMTPMIGVVAVAIGMKDKDGKPDIQGLKELLLLEEVAGLAPFFANVLAEAKVTAAPGEPAPPVVAAEPLSTETTTESSPSL